MTDAELRVLVRDCLTLWGVHGQVVAGEAGGVTVRTTDGAFTVQAAPPDLRPARWLLQTPARAAARRPPRVAPSIVAALSALRNALGGDAGRVLKIGVGGTRP